MKKLFLLLTAMLLSAGMVTQAQLLDAVKDIPTRNKIPTKVNHVAERQEAPQTTTTKSFSWSEAVVNATTGITHTYYYYNVSSI